MTTQSQDTHSNLLIDLGRLIKALPTRRKWQLGLLFILQIISALSEIVSLGAIIPFLSALTDIDGLMTHARVAPILEMLNITEPQSVVILMASIFAGAIVFANILRFFTLWAQMHLSAIIGTDVGTKLYKHTLYKPYSFFIKNNSSELIGNIVNDLNGALGALHGILTLITQGLIAISVATGLIFYNASVALAISCVVILSYITIMLLVRKRLSQNSLTQSNSFRSILKALQEGVGGMRYIATDYTHKNFIRHYRSIDYKHRLTSANNSIIRQAPRFFVEAVGVIALCVLTIILTAGRDNISDVIPLLGFLALASHRLLPAMQQIYAAISSIFEVRVAINRVMSVLEGDITPIQTQNMTTPLVLKESLRLKNVGFDYNEGIGGCEDQWTLKNIDLTIEAKKTVAFVGHTGSGKSTMSDLILGLITPLEGSLCVDGQDLTSKNLRAWQEGISHVPQSIFLIDDSIAANIAFGIEPEKIDMARVISAAQQAEIHDFIKTLPHQYDSLTGERGVKLSGGQMQRIGIARALYKAPSIVVFDEATSALDTQTENKVMKSIESLGREMTVILIAHRLSTVKNADVIFVFDQGRLVGQGTYTELLKTSTIFKELAKHGE